MANRNLPTYYLVEADMLPEIFLKVMEAKELLQTGECSTVGDAVNRVGISRSAFYKYKDSITAFQDLRHGHILTFQVKPPLCKGRWILPKAKDGRIVVFQRLQSLSQLR